MAAEQLEEKFCSTLYPGPVVVSGNTSSRSPRPQADPDAWGGSATSLWLSSAGSGTRVCWRHVPKQRANSHLPRNRCTAELPKVMPLEGAGQTFKLRAFPANLTLPFILSKLRATTWRDKRSPWAWGAGAPSAAESTPQACLLRGVYKQHLSNKVISEHLTSPNYLSQ